MTRFFLAQNFKRNHHIKTAKIWLTVCILSTEPAFAVVKKQGCKHSNTLEGFKGKFRKLQVSKPEVHNGQIGWNYSE